MLMNKRLRLLALSLLTGTCLFAQPKIEKSDPLEVPPKVGFDKVLLLHDGHTCYLHYEGEEGIKTYLYDANRKLVVSKAIKGTKWNANSPSDIAIIGTYEINGEIVIFLRQKERKTDILYRLRINEADGTLLKEEMLAQSKNENWQKATQQIHVVKDAYSGCYAVIYNDNLSDDADDAIKVMHFDEKHNLLSVAHMTSPDQKLKHIIYLDGTVCGNQKVYLSTYYAGSGDMDSKVFISSLKAGETTLTNKALDFTEDFHETRLQMGYNKVTKRIQLLMNTMVRSKRSTNTFLCVLCFIDPEELIVKGIKAMSNENINTFAHNTAATDEDFTGLPQGMIIKANGNTTILKENVFNYTQNGDVIAAIMGDIGISELDAEGNETQAYLLHYRTNAHGVYDAPYLRTLAKGEWKNHSFERRMNYSLQDHALRYIEGKKNFYLVTDTYCKDVKTKSKDKLAKIDGKRAHMNTYYATFRNGNVADEMLFGPLAGKKDKTMCFMDAADQAEDGLFASIVTFKTGKKTEARIVWAKFD